MTDNKADATPCWEALAEFDRMTIDTGYGDTGLWMHNNREYVRGLIVNDQRGKADVVPSGDAASLVEEYLSGFNYEDTEAAYKQYTKDSEKLTGMVLDITAAARAEGERIGAQRAVPDGFVVVPTGPNQRMLDAVEPLEQKVETDHSTTDWYYLSCNSVDEIYKAMLAAAPSPPKPGNEE